MNKLISSYIIKHIVTVTNKHSGAYNFISFPFFLWLFEISTPPILGLNIICKIFQNAPTKCIFVN